MASKKTAGQAWSSVKAAMASMNTGELVSLVGDLYRLSKENQIFFHSRFAIGDDILAPYKEIIDDCMYPDIENNKPYQIAKAKKAISSYSKAVGNIKGETELMIYFVECGNRFTLDYGDIDEHFYDALNLMYTNAVDRVLTLKEEERGDFQSRLKTIMDSSSGIGWGYHDMLCDDYYEAFPEDI